MRLASFRRGIGLALAGFFFAAIINLIIIPATSANAVGGLWASRIAIKFDTSGDGVYTEDEWFVDRDSFDDIYGYERQTGGVDGCFPDQILFSPNGINGTDFFYGDNEGRAGSEFEYITYSKTGGTCAPNRTGGHTLGDVWKRRVTFIKDGNSIRNVINQTNEFVPIANPAGGAYAGDFSRAVDRNTGTGGPAGNVFINVSDVNSSKQCKDVIVMYKSDPLENNFSIDAESRSSQLYAVQDNAGGKTAESMHAILPQTVLSPDMRCGLRHESVDGGDVTDPVVKYPVIKADPGRLQGSGWQPLGDGQFCAPNGGSCYAEINEACGELDPTSPHDCDYDDDSYMIFIGGPDSAIPTPPNTTPGGPGVPPPGGSSQPVFVCEDDSSGLAHVLCPIVRAFDGMMNWAFTKIIMPMLTVPALVTIPGLYEVWQSILVVANIVFIFIFFIIIFSQATSIGVSNYGIKKMLPRLVAVAILANISFWLCVIAVDFANILANGISSLILTPMQSLPPTRINFSGGWTEVIQSVGLITVSAAFIGAQGGLIAAAVAIVLPVALLMALTVLALILRLVIIVAFVAFSPIIFMGFILPGTQRLANRALMGFLNLLWAGAIVAALVSLGGFVVYIIEISPIS